MRRLLSGIAAALTFITIAVLGAAPANAATISINYVLDGTESTWSGAGVTAVPCSPSLAGNFYYRAQALTVDVDGDYVFWDTGQGSGGFDDGLIAIYSSFDPASPYSNCLAVFDDNSPSGLEVALTAGTTYTLVQSTYMDLSYGSYRFSAAGPGTVTVSALPVATTTSLTVAPNPATVGETVTLTATVTGDNPSGDVEFLADGVSLGTAPLMNGVATFPAPSFAVGTHAIVADYLGDNGNAPSSSAAPVALTVNPAPASATPTPPARVDTAK